MSAEDRKRFEQVDKRLEGMDANITDARSHIHRINDNIVDLNDRVTTIEKDMVRHEEQTISNFNDVRSTMSHNKEILQKDIRNDRNIILVYLTAIVIAEQLGLFDFIKGLM